MKAGVMTFAAHCTFILRRQIRAPQKYFWFIIRKRTFSHAARFFTVESRLHVQVGTQKFGRRTERDVQVKIIFRITP